MTDVPFGAAELQKKHKLFFEYLQKEFPDFDLWVRFSNYGRSISAGILSRATGVAVTVPIVRAGRDRSFPLHSDEIAKIRTHFSTEVSNDLELS